MKDSATGLTRLTKKNSEKAPALHFLKISANEHCTHLQSPTSQPAAISHIAIHDINEKIFDK